MKQPLLDRLLVWPQYLAPQHLLSRLMHRVARAHHPRLVQGLIRTLRRHYPIDLSDALEPDPARYRSLDDFFTRRLKPGARPLPADPTLLACPADGQISQIGTLRGGTLVQAKGREFEVADLLAEETLGTLPFRDGAFATLYLAPHNYHRVHSPADCRIMEVIYVPGRLFSVNARTARTVGRLFARNERVILRGMTPEGVEFAVVMVGAMLVGSMTLEFCDLAPLYRRRAVRKLSLGQGVVLARGEALGCFHLGSTVIVLVERGHLAWAEGLIPGTAVRVGQPLGRWQRR